MAFSRHPHARPLLLGLMLGLTLPLAAQDSPPASPNPAPAANAPTPATLAPVQVKGTRSSKLDPAIVEAAKSKVLSRNYASSCAFMSSYKASEDDVTLAYMRDFGLQDSPSNEAETFRETAPLGDASKAASAPVLDSESASAPDPNAPSVGCSAADRSLAAGRHRILRRDQSLAQGFDAFEAGDYALARRRFEEAYDKIGYDEAALMLGRIHLLGLGTAKDSSLAVAWLRKVTEARYDPMRDRLRFDPARPEQTNARVDAALLLAKIYMVGTGVQRNPRETRAWWERALSFGFVPAATQLGRAELLGYGGPVDARSARAHLQEAAEQGHVPAQVQLARLYQRGAEGVPVDAPRALAYYAAAAKTGHLDASYEAARMLDLGEAGSPDPARAIVFYKEAAVKGHADAQNALATYFYNGQQVPQDLTTARKLFQAAATRSQPDAMFNLGAMLARAEGGPKDMAMAYAWLSLAQRLGHPQAEAALRSLAPLLTAEERARADAVLKPKPKS